MSPLISSYMKSESCYRRTFVPDYLLTGNWQTVQDPDQTLQNAGSPLFVNSSIIFLRNIYII